MALTGGGAVTARGAKSISGNHCLRLGILATDEAFFTLPSIAMTARVDRIQVNTRTAGSTIHFHPGWLT